ncbi:MAG TPA: phosphatidylserine decarboxylase family protein [Gemmataceae bacterium]|nr:phosphatidylserine decarboxylase family protein [Gemmataceae bacterium]
MSTLDPPSAPPSPPVQPTGVQPGGGFCMSIELAWGRLRRALLRRFRPGYVRRMAEKRQGQCAGCPHDIIDPRDLKFCRNVCGYWFRPEDDRFRWRGRLGLARAGLAEVVIFSLLFFSLAGGLTAAALLIHEAFWWPLPVLALLWLEVIYFFRDPERTIPTDEAALLSPADGTVTHVGEVDDPDFPGGRALRVSIFLSIFNVHVNRLPRSGRVVGLRYFPGAFLDARHPECAARNEQLWIDLEERQGRLVRVKQISGAIARRIVCWLRPGEEVRAGERLGMIKFGSRTEVLLPASADVEVKVKVGDKVKGAATVLLRLPARPLGN